MAATTDIEPLMVAWQAAVTPAGDVNRGDRLRATDPRVTAYPHLFVGENVPESEWPNELDQLFADAEEVARLEREQRRAVFERAAKGNRVTIPAPGLHKLKHDLVASYQGRPATILRGSIVLGGSSLLSDHPDAFERVRG